MSDNNPGSQDGPPYGEQDQPKYGENQPKYGENQPSYGQQDQPKYGEDRPKYGENQPQYGQAPTPYGQQNPSPYGQQSPYGPGAGNYPGQQGYPVQTADNPGRTLGIVGFILAILIAPVGLIVSIVAFVKSRKAKASNGFALAGIIIGVLFTIIGTIVLIALIAFFSDVTQQIIEQCDGLPPGTPVTIQGQPLECP